MKLRGKNIPVLLLGPGILGGRSVLLCSCALAIGAAMGLVALGLFHLISFFTDLAFYHTFSTKPLSPADNHWGPWVIGIPAVGGLVVGFMAFWGHQSIRGHGIPEAMEVILNKDSRIHPNLTWLKPLSSAIAIGTGGPFGAEGPIIATGGAVGSVFGQHALFTPVERKILLASGAAAGMAGTFGVCVSATLLAVELLLFEFHPRSIIPVAFASAAALAVRIGFVGGSPMFPMADIPTPSGQALLGYALVGLLAGFASIGVTKSIYLIEAGFERIPLHWKWWPALGGLVVGVVGYICPLSLGIGYGNIGNVLGAGSIAVGSILGITFFKFISWSFALGSGTSGGTLAPLFTIGSGAGFLLIEGLSRIFPAWGLDPRVGALVGMAALFTGASRAFLTSVIFALELTHQPGGLLPLFSGCAGAYWVSCLFMRHTIMTEKIAKRGVRVPHGYMIRHHGKDEA